MAEREGFGHLSSQAGLQLAGEHVAKDATRANNATPPCPILPDGLVLEAVCLPQRPALAKPQPLGEGRAAIGSAHAACAVSHRAI